ncbi:ACP S-malonyltransferase [Legionella sp. km772]|uniref:ACP S-malonyltransferase n=1 Tax=Legionella sp. km772 TaxID=2498111 RepID=UPI000F8F7113|nr:ACP S-malonyltransferase [Legionella sp. km772]RUR07201.1 malonate decarboxylase subunit epsilon [Legionella sp. km772]
MKVLCLFAGQGYHSNDLFRLFQGDKMAENLLEKLSSVLKIDLLCGQWSLTDPYYSQFIIAAYHYTLFNLLRPALLAHQVNLAGYSLGEVSAFLASSQATIEEMHETIAFRTELMTSILKEGDKPEYDLLSIRGQFTLANIQELCSQYGCALAIINSEERLIIGGRIKDLKQILEQLPKYHLSHSQFLEIHLPSHTPFYADKKGLFQSYLNSLFSKSLCYPILSPLDLNKIYDGEQEKQLLDQELYTTLQWYGLCMLLPEYQYDLILDLGPSDALSKQLKTMNIDLPLLTVASYNHYSGVLEALKALT